MKIENLKSFFKNKNVLVTGHSGFSGSWLCHMLILMGAKVSGVSLKQLDKKSIYYKSRLKKILYKEFFCDIRNENKFKKCIKKINPEIVFHLASQPLVSEAYKNPKITYETNVLGTMNLLNSCLSLRNIKSILVVTSDKCYENNENKKYFKENDKLGGKDPYSSSKAAQEIVTQSMRDSFFLNKNCSISTARAGNIFGGGDWAKNRIIPDYYRAVFKNTPLVLRSPNSLRPWQFIFDVLMGYILLTEKHCISKKYEGSWNFGPNLKKVNVFNLVNRLNKFNSNKIKIKIKKNIKFNESKYLNLNNLKSKKRLKWKPLYNLDYALHTTNQWYQNCHKKEIDSISLKQIKNYFKKLL